MIYIYNMYLDPLYIYNNLYTLVFWLIRHQHFILSFLMACTSYFEIAFLFASNEIIFSIICSTSKTTFGQQLKIFPVQFAIVSYISLCLNFQSSQPEHILTAEMAHMLEPIWWYDKTTVFQLPTKTHHEKRLHMCV